MTRNAPESVTNLAHVRPADGLEISDRFRAAPDDREHRRAILGRHRVYAAVGTVVHLARRHGPGFVRIRALDEEDQLVPYVTMRRECRPGLESRQQRAALGDLVLPDSLLADSRACLDPRQFAQREDLRRRRAPLGSGRLDIAGV